MFQFHILFAPYGSGQLSSDGVTIKMPYGVDVLLHWPAFTLDIFLLGLLKLNLMLLLYQLRQA